MHEQIGFNYVHMLVISVASPSSLSMAMSQRFLKRMGHSHVHCALGHGIQQIQHGRMEHVNTAGRGEFIVRTDPWSDWQYKVVAIIRREYEDLLDDVESEDIDWDAWRPLYDEGRSARAAVEWAFVKDVSSDTASHRQNDDRDF